MGRAGKCVLLPRYPGRQAGRETDKENRHYKYKYRYIVNAYLSDLKHYNVTIEQELEVCSVSIDLATTEY